MELLKHQEILVADVTVKFYFVSVYSGGSYLNFPSKIYEVQCQKGVNTEVVVRLSHWIFRFYSNIWIVSLICGL